MINAYLGASLPLYTRLPYTDAIILANSGVGVLLTLPDTEREKPKRDILRPGSFAFIPAWTEHCILNDSEDEALRWTIIQNGAKPVFVDLDSWIGDPIQHPNKKKGWRKSKKMDKETEKDRMDAGWVIVRPDYKT